MGSFTCTQRSFGFFWCGLNKCLVLSLLRNNCGQLYTTRFLISLENQISETPLVHGVEYAILVTWSFLSHVEVPVAQVCLQRIVLKFNKNVVFCLRDCAVEFTLGQASKVCFIDLSISMLLGFALDAVLAPRATRNMSELVCSFLCRTRRGWCSWCFRGFSVRIHDGIVVRTCHQLGNAGTSSIS